MRALEATKSPREALAHSGERREMRDDVAAPRPKTRRPPKCSAARPPTRFVRV